MTEYVANHTGLSLALADALCVEYWQRYGTTLAGLRRHYPTIDPAHFLHATHQFPSLRRELRPMRGMKSTLRQLRGRKILFTNAPEIYARAVLTALGVSQLFDGIIAIQHTRLRPKPDRYGYHHLLRRYRLNPRRCIMVEDTRTNLQTAKRLGMTTVWLSRRRAKGPAVDILIRKLADLPRRISRQ